MFRFGGRIFPLVRKERLQIRRDPRTLAMMIVIPALWLVLFGYAATFDVDNFRAVLMDDGPNSEQLVEAMEDEGFDFVREVDSREDIRQELKNDRAVAGLSIERGTEVQPLRVVLLVDGSKIIAAQGAIRAAQTAAQKLRARQAAEERRRLEELAGQTPGGLTQEPPTTSVTAQPVLVDSEILYNPDLRTADFMIPGLIGMVILLIGGLMTSLGIVRERERGTLEQLIVTPLRPWELVLGKILPYAALAAVDLVIVLLLGIYVFDVPFRGSLALLFAVSTFFLLTALGIGLLISTVSQNQQQAMQSAVFVLFPQILLSGLIFPLDAIPWAVRWVSYLLPLTYFIPVARGTFLKDTGLESLWDELLILAVYSVLVLTIASLRFRKRLA